MTINTWGWNKGTYPVHSQQRKSVQNPLFQFGNFKNILDPIDHADCSSAVPPAVIIFCLATLLNLSACTVRGTASSPSPSILIGLTSDLTFPVCCNSSRVTTVCASKPWKSLILTI